MSDLLKSIFGFPHLLIRALIKELSPNYNIFSTCVIQYIIILCKLLVNHKTNSQGAFLHSHTY